MTDDVKNITFLNFDHSLTEQKYLQQFPHHWIDCSKIPHTNGFCELESLNTIRNKLHKEKISPLVLIGNGNYHYITYLLLEKITKPFSLILFDHHDDMMEMEDSLISCGSWVYAALKSNAFLQKVCVIGVNEKNSTNSLSASFIKDRVLLITEEKIKTTSLSEIEYDIRTFIKDDETIYISIDKDVLYKKEAFTNWDQGSMSLVQLLYLVEFLSNYYAILGMDICGEYLLSYQNEFSSSAWEHVKMNEIVNRALLEFIHELTSKAVPS